VKQQLATYIESYIKNPRMEEIPAILDIFQIKKFQKGDLFKPPFKPIDKIGFIINGSVRVYALKDNGESVILFLSWSCLIFIHNRIDCWHLPFIERILPLVENIFNKV